jgi:predicted nuclease of restriction endonuclease-like (RecB) superfamily
MSKKTSIAKRESSALSRVPAGYPHLLEELKVRIRAAQLKATLAANHELVLLYWQIGRDIRQRQTAEGWGAKVIDRLSSDLRTAFPRHQGFSPRNLKYMRAFAEAWPDDSIVQGTLAQITWYHHIALLHKLDKPAERLWYLQKTVEHGWSRDVMVIQIENGLHRHTGQAVTNFKETLPSPQSELAQQITRDPYLFDFLALTEPHRERELENQLIAHVERFLLALGAGFALVGRQVRLQIGGEESFLDLLFYHLKLRCFIVIDLKIGGFKPEYAGKMNFYLSGVDDQLRQSSDHPSVGLLLCRSRERVTVEYALRDIRKPIGVSEWQTRLTGSLPKEMRSNLPTIAELEAELKPPGKRKA